MYRTSRSIWDAKMYRESTYYKMDFKFKNLKRPLLSSSTVLYWKKHLKNANFTIHFLLLKVRKTTAFYWKFTKIFIVKCWPNKFASSRKSQKVVYFTHIQLSCDDMRLVAKRWKTCVDLRTTKVNCTSTQVGGQMKRTLNTSRKLVQWLASPFGQRLYKSHSYFPPFYSEFLIYK